MTHVLRRRAAFLLIALLLAQAGKLCLLSEAQAQENKFLGLKSKSDSLEYESYSKFYPMEIQVNYQGRNKGGITLQENLGGTMIPIGALSILLGWEIAIDQNNQLAEGVSPVTGRRIRLVPSISSLFLGDKSYKLHESEIIFYRDDVYVTLDALNRYLAFNLSLDRSKDIMTLENADNFSEAILIAPPSNADNSLDLENEEIPIVVVPEEGITEQDFASEFSNSNIQKPLEEMPVKNVEAVKIVPPEIEHSAKILLPVNSQEEMESSNTYSTTEDADLNAGASEDNVLVLQLNVNSVSMIDLVDTIERDGTLFLPLCAISQILEFPIECDLQKQSAEGWFIREGNKISLRLPRATVRGKTYNFKPEQYISNNEDMYFDQAILQEWFDTGFSVNSKKMELMITTETSLPFEDRMKREQLYALLEAKKKQREEEKEYTPYEFPYKAASIPIIDANFNSEYDEAAATQKTSLYNIHGAGDLGYLTSRYYVSGDMSNRALTDVRLNFGRDDYDAKLLGYAKATSFRFGDINSIGVSQIAQSSEGRGFTVTNRDIGRSDKFDVTSFIGDSTPGWDVELYRNGTLIDNRTVGNDGRYEFTDVPILFGSNIFRLLFLGPQGQIEEKIQNINADRSLIDKGEMTYNFSVDQKSQRLIEQREHDPNHPDGTRFVGEVEYGLSRYMTVTSGASRTYIEDGEHKYINAGLNSSFMGILTSLNHAEEIGGRGGRSSRLTGFANFYGVNVRAGYKVASNFVSEEDTDIDNPVKREADLDLNRTLDLPFLGELGTGLTFNSKIFEANDTKNTIKLRMSKNFKGFNISNSFESVHRSGTETQVIGDLNLRGALWGNIFSLNADYDIQPDTSINSYEFNWKRNVTSQFSNNMSYRRRFDSDAQHEIENAMTFDMKKYKLFLTGRFDSENNVYVGTGVNFSFGKYPDNKWNMSSRGKSETGLVVARTYLDKNFNLVRDEGEEAAENISMKIGSRFYTSDNDGVVVAENLQVNGPVYMYADDRKFKDKSLGVGVDGYSLKLRPGYVAEVDYPIFVTAEVEGLVEFPDGMEIPKDLKITLKDENGVSSTETKVEFDGYFLFRNVLPGTYYLEIPKGFLDDKGLAYKKKSVVIVGKDDDFVSSSIILTNARGL